MSKKHSSYQTDRDPLSLVHPNSKQGRKRDKNCSALLISDMKALTCAIYVNVNKLRYNMFMKSTNAVQILWIFKMVWTWAYYYPAVLSLGLHKRVNYQVFVWIHSHENKQGLPDLDRSGWIINRKEIEYDWVKGNMIVPEQLIDILCKQNVERGCRPGWWWWNDGDDDDDGGMMVGWWWWWWCLDDKYGRWSIWTCIWRGFISCMENILGILK